MVAEAPQDHTVRYRVSQALHLAATRPHSEHRFPAPSSSSNNIQDQCLIIADIYGVREKEGVAENKINLIPVLHLPSNCQNWLRH